MDYKRPLAIITLLGTLGAGLHSAHAQNTGKDLPAILRALQNQGVEVRVLTKEEAAQIRGSPHPDYDRLNILEQAARSGIYNEPNLYK